MDRPRILVLDDDKTFRSFLAELFIDHGFEVVQVIGGEEALCEIQGKEFDLATVDFDLPGWVNGIDFLKELKSLAPETEVILLTGNASEEAASEAIRHGAFTYYLKPLHHLDAFFQLIDQALESHRLKKAMKRGSKSESSDAQ